MAGGGVVIGPDKGAGVISHWKGLVWSAIQVADPKTAAPNNQISTMTCTSPTFCVAADQYEHTLQWNGTKWFFPARLNAPYTHNSFSVSCTSSRYCLVVGAVGNATGDVERQAMGVPDRGAQFHAAAQFTRVRLFRNGQLRVADLLPRH
jgi:hypothetical protein